VGNFSFFFVSLGYQNPFGALPGPTRALLDPFGALQGKTFFFLSFFLSSLALSELPRTALTGPRGYRKPPFWPSRAPHGPITKSRVTSPLFGPTCLGFFHKHGKSPDPPSSILHGTPWEGGGRGGALVRYQGPREALRALGGRGGAAKALGDCAAKDLRIMGRRADANSIPVYLNHRLSTPQGWWSAAVFYPLGHPMP
jgi:hypothetical protein